MANIRTEESILDELETIQRKMMQTMVRLTSIGNPQVSSINLELTQLVRSLVQLKEDTKARFKLQQERLEALACSAQLHAAIGRE